MSVEPPKFETYRRGESETPSHLAWFNILLIIVTIVSLVWSLPAGCFMAALHRMLVNYRDLKDQGKRMDEHAVAAMMASILFGAGCFTGILGGCGMLAAMAQDSVISPGSHGSHCDFGGSFLHASVADVRSGQLLLCSTSSNCSGGRGGRCSGIGSGPRGDMQTITVGFPISPLTHPPSF